MVPVRGYSFQLFGPGACFSKVPKLFGPISGDIILFVSSKRRRLEARNFAVILIFIPFTTYEKTSFTEKAGRSFTNGFSDPKSSRDFRETGPCFGFSNGHLKRDRSVRGVIRGKESWTAGSADNCIS